MIIQFRGLLPLGQKMTEDEVSKAVALAAGRHGGWRPASEALL